MTKNLCAAVLAGCVLTLSAVPVRAQIAIRELAAAAGVDAAPLVEHLKVARGYYAADRLAVSREGKDVLANCVAMDVKAGDSMNVKTAALLVQTCLNNRYRSDGSYLVQARAEEGAIRIVVSGQILTGDPVLADLRSTLTKREHKLLGFDAVLHNVAAILQ